jgi:fucose 4-O-acetylase-like acetyltransferase
LIETPEHQTALRKSAAAFGNFCSMSEHQGVDVSYFRPDVGEIRRPSENVARAERHRLLDIDRAKGLAILLVVFGHIVARQPPLGNDWYMKLQGAIYVFHMPFFMYLSGVVFGYGGNATQAQAGFGGYLAKRAERLLIPFVAIGLAVLIGKMVASHFLFVDNNPESLLGGLKALVWNTDRSPATSIWFIFVLFCYCALTPVALRLTRNLLWPVLLFSIGLYFVDGPPLVYLDRITFFYGFFVAGILVGQNFPAMSALIDRTYPIFCALFAASLALVLLDKYSEVAAACGGFFALPALHGLVRSNILNGSKTLLWLGQMPFAIYLFNTLFIGLAKGVLLAGLSSWDGRNFLIFCPALMAAGLFGPIILKLAALDRVPMLRKLTD